MPGKIRLASKNRLSKWTFVSDIPPILSVRRLSKIAPSNKGTMKAEPAIFGYVVALFVFYTVLREYTRNRGEVHRYKVCEECKQKKMCYLDHNRWICDDCGKTRRWWPDIL